MAPSIAVIDDDPKAVDCLSAMLRDSGFRVHAFGKASDYLAISDKLSIDCIVCELCQPSVSALEVHKELRNRGASVPLIVVTGSRDIDAAVRVMKAGAYDLFEKPVLATRLGDGVKSAIEKSRQHVSEKNEVGRFANSLGKLSKRQLQVMELTVQGFSNVEIARQLEISRRTVETYRAWVMQRTGARTLAELLELTIRSERSVCAQSRRDAGRARAPAPARICTPTTGATLHS